MGRARSREEKWRDTRMVSHASVTHTGTNRCSNGPVGVPVRRPDEKRVPATILISVTVCHAPVSEILERDEYATPLTAARLNTRSLALSPTRTRRANNIDTVRQRRGPRTHFRSYKSLESRTEDKQLSIRDACRGKFRTRIAKRRINTRTRTSDRINVDDSNN